MQSALPDKLLERRAFLGRIVNLKSLENFKSALNSLLLTFHHPSITSETIFVSDSMIAWGRNLSFLRDPFFQKLVRSEETSDKERGIVWRTYQLDYFADIASRVPGDFVELGVLQGYSAKIISERVDFKGLNKRYVLYDLFGWSEGDSHTPLAELNDPELLTKVRELFADKDFIQIVPGRVPDSFDGTLPDTIAFAHIDLNDADAEASAFQEVYSRLSSGGIIIFDDYGWWAHSAQKIAIDEIAERFGERILELSTGQGLLIKK